METEIRKIWEDGGYKSPRIPLMGVATPTEREDGSVEWIRNNLVVIDEGSVFTLMDSQGNIYYVASNKCSREGEVEVEDPGHEDDRMHPRMQPQGMNYFCLGPLFSAPFADDTPRVQYARKEIIPNVFTFPEQPPTEK